METEISVLVLVALAGALGELLDAPVGMGFGVLTSSLMVASGVAPGVTATTVNLAKVGSGAFSAASHWRFGNIRWQWFLPLLVPGVAGAVTGGVLVAHLPRDAIRLAVPLALMGLSLVFLQRALFPGRLSPGIRGGSQGVVSAPPAGRIVALRGAIAARLPRFVLIGIGYVAGLINAVTGGYGPFATSALALTSGGHPRFAVGTANMVEIFVAGTGAATLLATAASKGFRWEVVVALMAGSFFTAPLGAYLSRRVPAQALMLVVGLALLSLNAWSIARALA